MFVALQKVCMFILNVWAGCALGKDSRVQYVIDINVLAIINKKFLWQE